jgi:hypothetical protein
MMSTARGQGAAFISSQDDRHLRIARVLTNH